VARSGTGVVRSAAIALLIWLSATVRTTPARPVETSARRLFQPLEGAAEGSPGCSAAKPWANPQNMAPALEGRRKAGGIPDSARVAAAPPGLGSILLDSQGSATRLSPLRSTLG